MKKARMGIQRVQKGFTLIELMIVVAIIGILAAIAIPQYQDYVAKTQVARVVSETSAYKTAIEDRLNQGAQSVSSDDVGYVTSTLVAANPFATAIAPGADGSFTYTATIGGNASKAVSGATVTLARDKTGTWKCTTAAGGSQNWKTSYAPAGCGPATNGNGTGTGTGGA